MEHSRERQKDRETERQRDRETERQRDRETERQRDREKETSGRCMLRRRIVEMRLLEFFHYFKLDRSGKRVLLVLLSFIG